MQCISVAHADHAYVTDHFTVTHNTMVALRAMLAVVDSGGQAAMLAPTEVLAQQHHRSVTEMMGELAEGGMLGGPDRATKVVLLTGSMGAAARRQALLDLVTGEAGIVIGTHALIEDKVKFHDLGLVVVDEQHRFGVEQRDALRGKGKQPPHLLVMTATPIPRTVAMTVFGDLEPPSSTSCPPAARRSPAMSSPPPTSRTSSRAPGSGSARRWATGTRPTSSAPASATRRTRRRSPRRPPRTRPRSARRSPSSTSPRSSAPAPSRACASPSCTAACTPTTRTTSCAASPPANSTSSSPPPSSRSASTCPTPPPW
ncbi:Transcription-repair-coupling factor [Streptomyces tanashiensis]